MRQLGFCQAFSRFISDFYSHSVESLGLGAGWCAMDEAAPRLSMN